MNILEYTDYARRWQGKLLDALGCGPIETPSRLVFREPGLTFKRYNASKGPVVMIIPAPIKRAYIWDLTPQCSVVRHLMREGISVHLIDWARPGNQERGFGLAEYAGRLILDCLKALGKESGSQPVILAGHSLGGTLAAIFAALYPERIAGLILLGAPLHFGPQVDPLSELISRSPPAHHVTALMGNIPGSFLDLCSLWAAPDAFLYSRWRDWLASLPEPQACSTHLRVERWTLDESPLAQRLFEEVTEWLYREDRLAQGTLNVGARSVHPEQIRAPLMCVAEKSSAIAPPISIGPVYEAARSAQKAWLWYEGDIGVNLQHAGLLVGQTAHQQLWPQIVRWIHSIS